MWPNPQDYNEAVQNPCLAFSDHALRDCAPTLTALGLPKPVSGSFASVYEMVGKDGSHWAVRCFLRNVPDQALRYVHISNRLKLSSMSYMVPFEYIPAGIRIGADFYPILKMEWVHGMPFTEWLQRNHDNSQALSAMHDHFTKMCSDLQGSGIAHGDLQHGNMLVTNDAIKLVDYDGLFVPELASLGSSELGHRHYQHPHRTSKHFGTYLDNFSSWSIATSIKCLIEDPRLWRQLGAGDECLLFRQEDYCSPRDSVAFGYLEQHESQVVRDASRMLRSLLLLDPKEVPPLGVSPRSTSQLEDLPPFSLPGFTPKLPTCGEPDGITKTATLRELRDRLVLTAAKSDVRIVAESEPADSPWFKSQGLTSYPGQPPNMTQANARRKTPPQPSNPLSGTSKIKSDLVIGGLLTLIASGVVFSYLVPLTSPRKDQATQEKQESPIAAQSPSSRIRVVTKLTPLSMTLPTNTEGEKVGSEYFDLGLAAYREGAYQEAYAFFEKASLAPWQIRFDQAICDYQKARCDCKLGKLEEAAVLMESVQQSAARFGFAIPTLKIDLGYTYLKLGNFKKAQHTFQQESEFRKANQVAIHAPTVGLHQVALQQLESNDRRGILTYMDFLENLKDHKEWERWNTGQGAVENLIRRDTARVVDPDVRTLLEKKTSQRLAEFREANLLP